MHLLMLMQECVNCNALLLKKNEAENLAARHCSNAFMSSSSTWGGGCYLKGVYVTEKEGGGKEATPHAPGGMHASAHCSSQTVLHVADKQEALSGQANKCWPAPKPQETSCSVTILLCCIDVVVLAGI